MRKEKKEGFFSKKNIISLFIVFVMVFSVGGFIIMQQDNESQLTYKGISFERKGNSWTANINNIELEFEYLPSDVEDINLSSDIINSLSKTLEIDTTADFNSSYKRGAALAQYRMNQNLVVKNIYVRAGTLNNLSGYNIPIITCADSTPTVPVLFFKESNETKIYLLGNCIIAEGKSDIDFIRIGHRVMYGIFGVI